METPYNTYNNLGGDASATVFFIIEEAKVAFLDFSQGTVKVFYFYFLSTFNTIWDSKRNLIVSLSIKKNI